MKMHQVSDHCFAVINEKNRVCDANSGLINVGGGVVIDTQSDLSHARQMIELFGTVWSAMPQRVINTHEDMVSRVATSWILAFGHHQQVFHFLADRCMTRRIDHQGVFAPLSPVSAERLFEAMGLRQHLVIAPHIPIAMVHAGLLRRREMVATCTLRLNAL